MTRKRFNILFQRLFKKKMIDTRLVVFDAPRWWQAPINVGMWNDLVKEVNKLKLKELTYD